MYFDKLVDSRQIEEVNKKELEKLQSTDYYMA